MKVRLITSDLYPVHSEAIRIENGTEVEIEDGLWRRYCYAKDEFYELLDEVEDVVLAQRKNGI